MSVQVIEHVKVNKKTTNLAHFIVSKLARSVSGKVSIGSNASYEFIAIELTKHNKPRQATVFIDYKARTVKCLTYKRNGQWVQRFADNMNELQSQLKEFRVI